MVIESRLDQIIGETQMNREWVKKYSDEKLWQEYTKAEAKMLACRNEILYRDLEEIELKNQWQEQNDEDLQGQL